MKKGIGRLGFGVGSASRRIKKFGYGHTSPWNQRKWFFTGERIRYPTLAGTMTAGKEHTRHKTYGFNGPNYSNNFYIAVADHYLTESGGTPVEITCPNDFDVEGISMYYWNGSTWVGQVLFGVANKVAITPADNKGGKLFGPITFAQDVPPWAPLQFIMGVGGATNGIVPVGGRNMTGTFENGTISSTDFYFTQSGSIAGSDGRLGGRLFGPSFVIAEYKGFLARPVPMLQGDSILYGKNENENALAQFVQGLAFGFMSKGLSSDIGKRMTFGNFGFPSVGPPTDATKWPRRAALLRQCPNRPYTTIITEHYNNGPGGDYDTSFKPGIKDYYALLKQESRYWGDAECELHQTLPIPRPGSTDWCTTLAGQGSSGENHPTSSRWRFYEDLKAGNVYPEIKSLIDLTSKVAYDMGANIDRWKMHPLRTTLALPFTSGGTQMTLSAPAARGDMIVIDAAGTLSARHVTSVTGNVVNLESAVSTSYSAGVSVAGTYVGDNIGLHPASCGGDIMAEAVTDWKQAEFADAL